MKILSILVVLCLLAAPATPATLAYADPAVAPYDRATSQCVLGGMELAKAGGRGCRDAYLPGDFNGCVTCVDGMAALCRLHMQQQCGVTQSDADMLCTMIPTAWCS